MATKTDLAGMLRNDDENLTARLSAWITTLESADRDLPASAKLYWKVAGATSEELLDEVAIVSIPTSGAALVEAIAEKIRAKLGPSPEGGSLRVRVARKGGKSSPDIDFQRRLVGAVIDDEPNMAVVRAENERLRGENQELRRQNVELVKCNTTSIGSLAVQNAELGKAFATVASARGAAGAADEMSGLTTFLGLLTFYFFWPHIKAAMGLSPQAGLKDVVEAGRKMMAGELAPLPVDAAPMKVLPPPGAGRNQAPPAPPAPPIAAPAVPPGAEDFVARLQDDEKFRREVAQRIMTDSALLAQLQTAAMSGSEAA